MLKKFSPIRKDKNQRGRQKIKNKRKEIGKLEGKVGLGGLMKVETRESSSQGMVSPLFQKVSTSRVLFSTVN